MTDDSIVPPHPIPEPGDITPSERAFAEFLVQHIRTADVVVVRTELDGAPACALAVVTLDPTPEEPERYQILPLALLIHKGLFDRLTDPTQAK